MATSATTTPLVARSSDGSLIGIHHHDTSSTSKTGLIRCYDGNISNGSLKFTLRVPLLSSSPSSANEPTDETKNVLRKLTFGSSGNNDSPSHLCGMLQSTSSILVWDLDRGVLAQTVNVRNITATPKKKKRKSSVNVGGNEVLCDIATHGDQLYALVFFPDGLDDRMGKLRVYQYDLSAKAVTLVKKIKVGSVPADAVTAEGSIAGSFAIAISRTSIAIRMCHHLRVLDLTTGDRLGKVDFPSSLSSSNKNEESSFATPLSITPDGRYIVTISANNQVIVLSDKHELQTMALLSTKDDSSPITHLDLTASDDDELTLLTFQPLAGIASLFTVATKTSSSMVPQMPQAQLQTNEKDSPVTFIQAGFHPRKPDEDMVLLFQQAKQRGGSAAGGTNLPMESLSYGSLEGTVTVGTSLAQKDAKDGKKRKSAESLALAPGDQGQEASLAMDLTLGTKKAKVQQKGDDDDKDNAEDEDDFDDMEEDGEQGQSIAERLALLSSVMEQTDEEDDEDNDDEDQEESKKSKFKLKSATSETLATLLTQALSSNDAVQLNIALQVTDRRLVEGTVRALQSIDAERGTPQDEGNIEATRTGFIPTLMAHIVRRMARRHSLVMPLGVWVRAILAATARSSTNQVLHSHGSGAAEEQMAREGREMAMKLGPLKNFLNERVESFPQLLRLEGRLALLNNQL
mmetsp:Transcript_19350/g.33983  ORF Transcript_19350/g.33983 Transcript_19350/m.33983 type:complete len:687 (+) Transcript_19350:30-2090(+)